MKITKNTFIKGGVTIGVGIMSRNRIVVKLRVVTG